MGLQGIHSGSIHNSQASQHRNITPNKQLRAHFRNILDPVRDKPLVAGGTALTFGAFIASLLSLSSTTALSFIPIFGIPAIALFAIQIFSNFLPSQKPQPIAKQKINIPEAQAVLEPSI